MERLYCHVFTTAQNMVRTETLFGRISTDENDLLLRYECPCPKIQILLGKFQNRK